MRFQLREGHFDGVQVWRVFWQIQEPCAAFGQRLLRPRAFVHVEIIQDHDIAFAKGRRELGFNISVEGVAIHRAINDPRRSEFMAAQTGDEGLGMPFAKRCLPLEPFAFRRPATQAAHVGFDRCFIDEDKATWLSAHRRLAIALPLDAGSTNITAFLFRRQQCFFYSSSQQPEAVSTGWPGGPSLHAAPAKQPRVPAS